jgi:hypothetical protein
MRLRLPLFKKRAAEAGGAGRGDATVERLINIDGTIAASGLRWIVPLAGEGATEAGVRRIGRRVGAKRYLRARAAEQNQDYFAFLTTSPPRRVHAIYSLAAWFAAAYANEERDVPFIYVRPVDGGMVALCACVNGEPDPQLDRVADPTEAVEILDSLRRSHVRTQIVVDEIFGDEPAWLEPLSGLYRMASPLAKALPPLSALLAPMPAERRTAGGQGALLALGIAGLAYLGYEMLYVPWRQAEDAKTKAPPVPPEVAYIASRDAAWAARGPHGSARETVRAIHAGVAGLPTSKGGWLLTKVACDAGRGDCALTWRSAEGMGTYERYRAAPPAAELGAAYTSSLDLKGAAPLARVNSSFAFDALPTERAFFLSEGSRWQRINALKATLGATASFGPPALLGTYSGTMGEALPGRVLTGNWTLDLPLGALYLIEDLPPNMTLRTITMDVGSEIGKNRAQVSGAYYVR